MTEAEIIAKSWTDRPQVEKDILELKKTIKLHIKVHEANFLHFKSMATTMNITIPVISCCIAIMTIVFKRTLSEAFYYASEIGPLITPLLWLVYKWYDPTTIMANHANALAAKTSVLGVINGMLEEPVEKRDEMAQSFKKHIDHSFAQANGAGPLVTEADLKPFIVQKKQKSKKD